MIFPPFGRCPRQNSTLVFVVVAPPIGGLVAALGGAVEPLVGVPEAVQSARIGRIGVVDDTVLGHERAHARTLAGIGGDIGPADGGADIGPAGFGRERRLGPVVVVGAAFALLLFGDRDAEVGIEV